MTKTKLDKMFENDFIRLPRPFIRMFNLNTAVMLAEIYSEYTYWKSQDKLEKGGWFFSTVENMYCNTGLSKHQQLIACKISNGFKELEEYLCNLPLEDNNAVFNLCCRLCSAYEHKAFIDGLQYGAHLILELK